MVPVGLGPTICLVSEGSGGIVPEGDDPPLGEAQFFLARVRGQGFFKTGYGRSSAAFRRGAAKLGYRPFAVPMAINSRPYFGRPQ